MLSLWKACTWCYMRACSFPDLGPKTLLANLEFLPLIMARHGQKGLRLSVLSALRGSKGKMALVAGTFPSPN
ncbi:rCG46957 [Rattus norvegicus]|uniref:RCG46957 n=1 Tax=Rattus norvegicus TaxID=10116 RepID=A6IXQ2_RAT|nr:rCG46957 [Rattus norvegicus]